MSVSVRIILILVTAMLVMSIVMPVAAFHHLLVMVTFLSLSHSFQLLRYELYDFDPVLSLIGAE